MKALVVKRQTRGNEHRAGASILGGLGEQSSTLFKVGVNRSIGHFNYFFALGSSDSCVKSEVCFTVSHVGD